MSYPAVHRWLAEHTSLEPSLLTGAGFDALVAERLAALGGDESAYVAVLDQSEDEVDRLAAGIAVPETWFFRYPQSFRLLAEFMERKRMDGCGSIRMMSIGCATGEEPYSMAMVAVHAGWSAGAVDLEAIDRNRVALARAEARRFGAASFRTEMPQWAADFLQRAGSDMVVDPAVCELVRFLRADVTRSGAFSAGPACDVIFCRNLLIYLDEDARKSLLHSICDVLAPGGLLCVGHAEPLLCAGTLLRLMAVPHAFALERTFPDLHRPPAPTALPGRAGEARTTRHAPMRPAPEPPQIAMVEPTIDDARDLADAGRAAEGEALVRTLLARRGPSAEALELLGMIRMARNDLPDAKRCFEQAVYLEPSRTASLLQLAVISESAGDARRARALWNRAQRASESKEHGR